MGLRWQTASFDELDNHALYAALRLRQEVFAVEQASIYVDPDNLDQQAVHMLAWDGDQLVGYQRFLPPGLQEVESTIGRVIVAESARGTGLGKELVRRGIEHNIAAWPDADIRIHAQAHLDGFYGAFGFVAQGEVYDLDGIPHVEMVYPRPS